jgi:hypothetical protein
MVGRWRISDVPAENRGTASVAAAYRPGMEVTFTKLDDRRYSVSIERDHGPALVPRPGPGHDSLIPHDVAHYVVEECFEIQLGVWGQLAAGGGGLFWPAPEENTLKYKRRVQRIGAIGRGDMTRSEQLVQIVVPAWERSIDRIQHQPSRLPIDLDPDTLHGAVRRMDEIARRWQELQPGGWLTSTWPRRLTLDVSKSRKGRRRERSLSSARPVR